MGGLVELGKAVRREREREDVRKKDLNNYPAVHERSEPFNSVAPYLD